MEIAMPFEAPVNRWRERVRPEWLDYNGHMNVAYFVLIFDHGTDEFYPLIGLGKPYRQRTGKSTFAVESHITYQKELSVNEEVRVTTQLLGYDAKRIHYFHTMWHADKGFQMATLEQLAVHVDLTARKVEPMPDDCQRLLAEMWESHKDLPLPKELGSVMALRPKKG
ncbi:MAG: thioesterase family protein [Rhodospirillales bacterium]|nr:thioesterase family protein [Rhodospirillales bacterium]